ncbi:MAG TPA: hypothetical protein VGN70_05705 [Gammaproteobacteria bacterium]
MRYLSATLSGMLLGAAALAVSAAPAPSTQPTTPNTTAPSPNNPMTPNNPNNPVFPHNPASPSTPPSGTTHCPPGSAGAPHTRAPFTGTASRIPGTPPPGQTPPLNPCG